MSNSYRIHYGTTGFTNISDDIKIYCELSMLKSRMEEFFTRQYYFFPTDVINLATGESVDKSLWGFYKEQELSEFDSWDDDSSYSE